MRVLRALPDSCQRRVGRAAFHSRRVAARADHPAALRLEARGRDQAIPDYVLRSATEECEEHDWRRDCALSLVLGWRDGSGSLLCAGDREQAAIIFEIAKQMVEQEPRLKSRCDIYRRSIVYPRTGSAYHVLSADVPTKHGKNSHGVIFDELHVQPNRHLYDVMKTSMGSRRQPLMVMFTTAGHDRESICWEEHDYALKVRDGIVKDDTYLPVIYSAADTDDWTDPKVWAAANPGLGISIKLPYLEEECARAKESPAYQNTFRNLYLDQWTEQSTRWLDMSPLG